MSHCRIYFCLRWSNLKNSHPPSIVGSGHSILRWKLEKFQQRRSSNDFIVYLSNARGLAVFSMTTTKATRKHVPSDAHCTSVWGSQFRSKGKGHKKSDDKACNGVSSRLSRCRETTTNRALSSLLHGFVWGSRSMGH